MKTLVIRRCPMCGKASKIECDAEGYVTYMTTSTPIQEIFPDMDLTTRETLISGMCVSCQESFFMEDDEEDCDGECSTCEHYDCPLITNEDS